MADTANLARDLSSLKIDRGRRRDDGPAWAKWWIILGVLLLAGFGLWRFVGVSAAPEVETLRVAVQTSGASADPIVLNAAGYVVAHHKIEVASKVPGRVAWIGVEKGDQVSKGDVLVRLEDAEFRARVQQSEGNVAALKARLAELEAGSRPEEIQRGDANLLEARADLAKAKLDLDRAKQLSEAGVVSRQDYDNAKAQYDAQQARVAAFERSLELLRIGPRQEEIASMRGQVHQAEGQLAYDRTLLDATLIRAPVTGAILERNVETGEFVTTGFVGDRGAKGYVVSLADLDDLQVELDISQDDFSKLQMGQRAKVTTDAFRDREYDGELVEISPEADRQKATVQVKVQVLQPDEYLRPEMNANVAFLADNKPSSSSTPAPAPAITIPASAVRDGQVFLLADGKAVARQVEVRRTRSGEAEVASGLSGGETLILSPPEGLADGDEVRQKGQP
jgi:HlyD family secretion protein